MALVYVLDQRGTPLMPTSRYGHVRHLLKAKKAVVVKTKPFTIRLKYQTDGACQPIILGIDPGRTNIGLCAVTENGKPVFSANLETNNKDVPKRMAERAAHRRASRQGERKRRQRRAVKYETIFHEGVRDITVPGTEKPIHCKFIKNSEARFRNRVRPAGWLTPTANHLLECTLSGIRRVQQYLPISGVVLEVNRFAFMAMENPNIRRWEYQRGPLYGKGSIHDAVFAQQNGHCIFCESGIEHYHHIVPRSKQGSNTLPNIAGLCERHHSLVHTEQEWTDKLAGVKAGLNKKYHALSVLNQIIPSLIDRLEMMFPGNTYITDGRSTKEFREDFSIAKDHYLDAYCIACSVLDVKVAYPPEEHFYMVKFRQHDRAATSRLESRKYYLDGKLVAKNRHKGYEQKDDSLEELQGKNPSYIGKLHVVPGGPKYKDIHRILPGAIFRLRDGTFVVLRGRHGKSKTGKTNYFDFYGEKNYVTPRNCKFISVGKGWRFV